MAPADMRSFLDAIRASGDLVTVADLGEAVRMVKCETVDLFAPANGALAWNGRYLVVGFAGGEIPTFAANRLLVKNRSALGFSIRHYRRSATDLLQAEAARQFASFAAGTLRPHVSAVGGLDDVPAMLRRIMDRRAVGKMAVTP